MASKHNSIRLALVCLLVVILTSDCTSAKPFGPLIAFKKGLKAGFLKSLALHSLNTGNSNRNFRGTASGNLNFTGSATPIRSSNQQSSSSYGSPYYNGAQFHLTSNARVSGNTREVYSDSGRATLRKTLSGNVTFNASVNPIRQQYIVPASTPVTYVAPPPTEIPYVYIPPVTTTVAPFVYIPPATMTPPPYVAPATTPAARVVASIVSTDYNSAPTVANGFSAVEANIIRSWSGMAYGNGNININVANAGSGTGAIIHIGRGSATGTDTNLPAAVETYFDDSSSETYQPLTDDSNTTLNSYLPPSEDFVESSDSYSPLSEDFVVSTDSLSDDSNFGTYDTFETPNETDAFTNTDTFTDFDSNTGPVSVVTVAEPTSNPENTLEIKFSASGSGQLEKKNGISGEGNANFQSTISTRGSSPTAVNDADYSTTLDDYSGSIDDTNFDTPVDNTDFSSTSNDYVTSSDTVGSNAGVNDFQVETNGFVSGSTSDITLEPTVTATGPFSDSYDKYIKANVAVLRELSDIAKVHGPGLPLNIRLRTRHRVSQRPNGVVNPTVVVNAQSVQSSAGDDVINLFSEGGTYDVSKAPLLYKYSDIIESPDAVTLDPILHTHNDIEGSANLLHAKQLQSSLRNTRRVSGARRRVGEGNQEFARQLQVSPSGSRRVNYQPRNVQPDNQTRGKAIPSVSIPGNTIQQNALNIDNKNSPHRHRERNSATTSRPSLDHSMMTFLAQFAEAHRLSLIRNRSGNGGQNSNLQNSNGRTAEIQSGSRSKKHASAPVRSFSPAMRDTNRPTRGIPTRRRERPEEGPETVRDEQSPSRHARSFSNQGRGRIPRLSSLDRKENSGISRAKIVGRFSDVIPSPSF